MTHTPDHRSSIRKEISEWIKKDVKIAGKTIISAYAGALEERIMKLIEEAKKQDGKDGN